MQRMELARMLSVGEDCASDNVSLIVNFEQLSMAWPMAERDTEESSRRISPAALRPRPRCRSESL